MGKARINIPFASVLAATMIKSLKSKQRDFGTIVLESDVDPEAKDLLINNFDQAGLLNKIPFRKTMAILERSGKLKLPGSNDWQLVKMVQIQVEM